MLAACGALLICGCATTLVQTTTVPVNIVGCSSNLLAPVIPGGDPRVALIFFGLELGYDVGAYGTCEAGKLLYSAPDAVVSDGVYHSGMGTFSVSLPPLPAGMVKPSINIVQPSVLPTDYAVFWLMDGGVALKSGAIAYAAGTSAETEAQLSVPLEQEAAQELHHSAITTNNLGQNATSLLHHELVTLDGHPASFAVYSSEMHVEGSGSQPLYLLTYFTRVKARSAVIMILWQGECPACKGGQEADIRKLDSGIGRYVGSFHLDEAAIAALKPESPNAGQNSVEAKSAPPVLPSIDVPPGKALIYFYRESHFAGGGLDFHLAEDGNELGTLTNGTYLHTIIAPGAHVFILSTSGSDDDQCQVQVKSGDVFFLEVYVSQPAAWPFSALVLSCREITDLEALPKMATIVPAQDVFVAQVVLQAGTSVRLKDQSLNYVLPTKPQGFQLRSFKRSFYTLLGGSAEDGADITTQDEIPDPALEVSQDVETAMALHYSTHDAGPISAPPAALAATPAAPGASGYILQVTTTYWELKAVSINPIHIGYGLRHYGVYYDASLRLVDSRDGNVLASGKCDVSPPIQGAPTLEEALADNGKRLREMSQAAAQECALAIEDDYLGIHTPNPL